MRVSVAIALAGYLALAAITYPTCMADEVHRAQRQHLPADQIRLDKDRAFCAFAAILPVLGPAISIVRSGGYSAARHHGFRW